MASPTRDNVNGVGVVWKEAGRASNKERAIRAWIEANPKEIERIARYREEADLYADAAAEIKRLCALMRSD